MQNSSRKTSRLDQTSARFGQRIPLELPVGLNAGALGKARGFIRNASISGAFIETTLELPLHTNLVVTLAIQGLEGAAHALSACVVRLDTFGLAVEWRDMASVDVIDLLQRAMAPARGGA
jgi:hypothetical protein